MDIIVLCGGLSAERDVSLSSGTLAAAALRRRGHRAILVDLFFGYTGAYDDPREIFAHANEIQNTINDALPDLAALRAARADGSRVGENVVEVCRAADLVFIALHGEDGEDGKIQALLDLYGVKYTGTGTLGSALGMNKGVAKELFAQNGIRTPRGILVHSGDNAPANVGFPCVVKPCSRGSSVGTSVVEDESGYRDALNAAFAFEDTAIVEQYIRGRECDVAVLRGKALPVIEICPRAGFYDYKNKYQSGMTDEYCPADFPPETTEKLQRAAEAVFRALHFEVYARMDFIVDASGEPWCLEGNTLPGLTPLSLMPQEAAAVGISYDELCDIIVTESLKKYGG
ncbi:MAG: D-alanine--D-alanine ligase [Oscillospiraceae bacterium]|jgi:D-alanine-D-alanine ligase|nr:D-alanine--D-alanine ligase [Oscillospiraceae bacterium]